MSNAAVADVEPLYRAWLLRHEMPDAYARWRDATNDRAPGLAFIAVACDGKLLSRLGRAASMLVSQAEPFAAAVLKAPEVSSEARATAQVVRSRVQQWKQRLTAGPALRDSRAAADEAAPAAADPQVLTLSDHLRIALRDYPYYRESTARALFRETLRLEAAGLQVIGAPFDAAIMLGTARFAARCWRGMVRGEVPTRNECATVIGLVQQWGVRCGRNPFLVDFSQFEGAVDDLAVSLCRDVVTCLTVASRDLGGAATAGFAMWEEAEEYLAYAVLSLRPNHLNAMDTDAARSFAAAAARLATCKLDDPSTPVPTFPEQMNAGGARMVLATTRFALPNGIAARRSALGMSAAA